MAMHNFYMRGQSDGRKTEITAGSGQGKTNGIDLNIYIRQRGESVRALHVVGSANEDGTLWFRAYDGDGKRVLDIETER